METWKKEGAMFGGEDMMNEWNKVWEEEAQLLGNQYKPAERVIQFQKENEFMKSEVNSLLSRAKELIEQG